jgi:hypothetical protein
MGEHQHFIQRHQQRSTFLHPQFQQRPHQVFRRGGLPLPLPSNSCPFVPPPRDLRLALLVPFAGRKSVIESTESTDSLITRLSCAKFAPADRTAGGGRDATSDHARPVAARCAPRRGDHPARGPRKGKVTA